MYLKEKLWIFDYLVLISFLYQVIPPLGNTTFNVVFLGRDEGDIDTHLFIHTSDGTLKYQVIKI